MLLFDFWEYGRSSYAPVSAPVIDHQPVPSATTTIAPRLSQILRSSGDSKLCRTCRLVCRDWANALPLGDPERCDLWLEDGVVWYRIEEEWRHLPREYWAWTIREKEWWVERDQDRWQLKVDQLLLSIPSPDVFTCKARTACRRLRPTKPHISISTAVSTSTVYDIPAIWIF